jgi:peptide/nickel transport system permease protein
LAGHQARLLSALLPELMESPGLRWWQGCAIPPWRRFWSWLLPGVSGPWLTVLGLQLGGLLGGAVLVETLFGIPGLGQLLVGALSSRDLPVIQGAVLLGAVLYVLTQLAVEMLQAFLDPRVR